MAYDKKFKQQVLKYLEEGHTQEATAQIFGIGTSAIKTWKKRMESGEGLEARIRQRQPRKIIPEKLREYVEAHPDAYISEIAAEFGCVRFAVQKALKKLGITRKKRLLRTRSAMKNNGASSEKQ
jgi:transposase